MKKLVDMDAERAYLGQVILSPDIEMESDLQPEMFGDSQNSRVYRCIKNMMADGQKPDILLITRADPVLDPVYVAELTNTVASSANWKTYAKAIRDSWLSRRLTTLGAEIQETDDPQEQMAKIDACLANLLSVDGLAPIVRIGNVLQECIENVEKRYNSKGEIPGLTTGIDSLDSATMGLQSRKLYVIGARPSQGKSALALQMALHLSIYERVPVGLISCESASQEIATRALSSDGRVSAGRIQAGALMTADFQKILEAAGRMHDAPMYIWDQANPRLTDVLVRARYMARAHKIKALFVDYAQIIDVPTEQDRRGKAEKVSLSMKCLARELNIPVVLLAQLHRSADGRRPTVADFQWTSQFEQDADVAALLYHEYAGEDHKEIKSSKLIIAKNRDGALDDVELTFHRDYVRFSGEKREN